MDIQSILLVVSTSSKQHWLRFKFFGAVQSIDFFLLKIQTRYFSTYHHFLSEHKA